MRKPGRFLPLVAVLGLGLALASLLLLAGARARMLADSGETRAAVEASLNRLLPPVAASARDPRLLAAAGRLTEEPYVAAVWAADAGGTVVFHWRGPGRVGARVHDLAPADTVHLLQALPEGALAAEVYLQLLTAAAMRREGSHNDVFRHLVRPVATPAGDLAAVVAVAHDVSPGVGRVSLGTAVVTLLVPAGLLAYWAALPLWVYLDARNRDGRAVAWAAFVVLGNLAGLLAYLILRPRGAGGR